LSAESVKSRSRWWYLLPIFLNITGGVIAYFAIRKDDRVKAKKTLILGIILLGIAAGIVIAGQIAHYSVPIIDPPGKIYSVNGTDMHLYCTGPESDGQPTIIIITGAGTQSPMYYPLQEKLSKTIRTCSYDRAGLGWSEPNDIPANAKNMSNELYQLLQTAKIEGPVILAGHSLGGIVSLIYSAEYEDQVVGIAFIDSSHYNQFNYFGKDYSDKVYNQIDEMLAIFWLVEIISKLGILNLVGFIFESPELIDDETQKMFAYFDTWAPPYATIKSEIINLELSFEQGKEAFYARGDLPIIAISASDRDLTILPETGLSEKELKVVKMSFHKELADLSTNGRHEVVDGTDHISILKNEATADHILSLVGVGL